MNYELSAQDKKHLMDQGITPPDFIEIDDKEYEKDLQAWRNTNPSHGIEFIHAGILAHTVWRRQKIAEAEKEKAKPAPYVDGKPLAAHVVNHPEPLDLSVVIEAIDTSTEEGDQHSRIFHWELRAIAIILLLLLLGLLIRPAHGQAYSHINSIQWQHNGTNITDGFFAYPFTINCSTNLNCTSSASVVTITATGGGGSGCVPPGTSGAFLYDDGAGNCLDIPDFTFNGTHTITLGASGVLAITAGGNITGITAAMIPTLNQNTTGSAAKWTTARNLAGNSVDGSANVAFANKFIVQGTTDTGLSGAQFLGALGTGIVKNTTTTGVLSIAAGSDLPTGIPIASVGSAGLSGTSPVAISSAGAISCSTCNTSSATVSSIATTSPITGGTITTTGTIACATCVVASSPGAGVAHFAGSTQTVTSSSVIGSDMASATVTATQLAPQYSKFLNCNSRGLGDGLNAIAAGTYLQTTCYNNTGVTVNLTGIRCFTDNSGTSSLSATNGAGTALLTGAVTCTGAYAAGTQSGTTTIASADFIKFTFIADGTSKQTDWVVLGTY